MSKISRNKVLLRRRRARSRHRRAQKNLMESIFHELFTIRPDGTRLHDVAVTFRFCMDEFNKKLEEVNEALKGTQLRWSKDNFGGLPVSEEVNVVITGEDGRTVEGYGRWHVHRSAESSSRKESSHERR